MKFCDICGSKNFYDWNYCIHCGNRLTDYNYCPNCNKLNEDSYTFCMYCSTQLKQVSIDRFEDLFNNFNKKLLENYELDEVTYLNLVNSVFEKSKYVNIEKNISDSKIYDPRQDILNICKIFAIVIPKNDTVFDNGHNFANIIKYDEGLLESIQIETLIHELAHCLLFEIMINLVCDIFKLSQPTTIIDSFVMFFLTNDYMKIFNEFCASTVASRFIPKDHRNYESYLNLLNQKQLDARTLDKLKLFANSFAFDIIQQLEQLIDEDLREQIKYKFNSEEIEVFPRPFDNKIKNRFSFPEKSKFFKVVLCNAFSEAQKIQNIKKLENNKLKIESGYYLKI